MISRSYRHRLLPALLLLATAAALPARAERLSFRVAFADVPGIEDLQAGRFDTAIADLETRLADPRRDPLANEWSTLCGAYVLVARYRDAIPACDKAVAEDDSNAARNNRGVLRAHLRDVRGALEDFSHVRIAPEQVDDYVDKLHHADARLMATYNFEQASRLAALTGAKLAPSPGGARVESLAEH